MDAQTLADAMGNTLALSKYQELLPGYLNAAKAAGINSIERAAMWAAQLGHESVGLRYMEEIASGAAYEGRRDLGNTQPGDGPRFKGRGPIQLTGRANYRAFTAWAHREGHSQYDFEALPHLLSEPHWGFLAATYYWTAARPQINSLSDKRDLEGVTRAINGGLNGIADRRNRYNRALNMGARLLPGGGNVAEKVLQYKRDLITQDTFYNCGPASVQTIVGAATGNYPAESTLGKKLGTSTRGTDYIGQFPRVLNEYMPGKYVHRDLPGYPDEKGKNTVWEHFTSSIDAGYGVVVNIVAPPSNYPKAVAPSTISPRYTGGVVYHYIAAMGYRDDGQRKIWIADSGFSPYGYWISFDQLCTLIVPKGYAYSTAEPKREVPIIESGGILNLNINSLVNKAKSFPLSLAIGFIDRATFENRALLVNLYRELGLDPDKVIADAIAEANK